MSVVANIQHYQRSIEKCQGDEERLIYCINKLYSMPVTVQHLQETGVGRTINSLRKSDGDVGDAARVLVAKWKRMVEEETEDESDLPENSTEDDDVKHNARSPNHRQANSEKPKRQEMENHKRDKRYKNADDKRAGSSKNSEEMNHKDRKRRKEYDQYGNKRNKVESEDEGIDEDGEGGADSDTGRLQIQDAEEHNNLEDESRMTFAPKSEIVARGTSSDDDYQAHSSKSSKVKDHSSSSLVKKEYHYEEKASKKDRHSGSTGNSHLNNRHKSTSHNLDKYRTKINEDASSSCENDRKKHTSSSKPKEKYLVDKTHGDRNSYKLDCKKVKIEQEDSSYNYPCKSSGDVISPKRKAESESYSFSSKKIKKGPEWDGFDHKKHKQEMISHIVDLKTVKEERIDNHDVRKGKTESGKDVRKSKSEHHDKESKKVVSEAPLVKADYRDKEIIKSVKTEFQERKKSSGSSKHKEEKNSKNESGNKNFNSSSSKDESSTKSKHKEKKEKHKERHRDKEEKKTSHKKDKKRDKDKKKEKQEVNSSSGTSFAEALGMCAPEKAKRKSTGTSNSSPSLSKKSTKSGANSTEKLPSFRDLLNSPSELERQCASMPLEPLDVAEELALPAINPHYRPLPQPSYLNSPPKKSMTEDETLNSIMHSKVQRTKVFSGNKTGYSYVPSLFDLCIRVLQENIDALEYTGGVPFYLLKPVLERATPDQLFIIEDYNAYLIEDTDHLWEFHCKKDFRNKHRQEMETWREMYLRCRDEREQKLRDLTANIVASKAKCLPVRKTQLAYVEGTVKPPRSIARKQAKFGTANAAGASSKVKSIPGNGNLSSSFTGRTTSSAGSAVSVPVPRAAGAASGGNNQSSSCKPKPKAPLMAKTLQLIRYNRFKR